MLALAVDLTLVPGTIAQLVLAAMVLSMLPAPLLIQFAEPIVRKFTANDWLARAAQITQIAATTMARQNHVIICGYGRSGQNLARLLEAEDIPFIALDADPERVREAAGDGSSVVYGDAGRREALVAAGLAKARAVVITFADTPVALKILHHVHELRPELPVIVRTLDDSELDRLLDAGAAEVVPEVLEGSLMLASHSLLLLGVPLNRVLARIRAIREERYSLFRGFFHGATDAADAAENLQPRLHSVQLPDRASAVGRTLAELELDGLRRGDRRAPPGRALAAARPGLGLRGRRRRRAARAAREARAGRAAGSCDGLTCGACRAPTRRLRWPCRESDDRRYGHCERRRVRLQSRSLVSSARPVSDPTAPAPAPAAARPEIAVELADVTFGYDRRPVLDGHLDDDSARQGRRDHGRLRLRQDDDPAPDRRAAAPQSGRVRVGGQSVPDLDRDELYALRRKIGMLFQFGALFTDMTVFENIAFPMREHTDLPEELIRDLVLMKLHAVGLRGAAQLMPSELSGGMARRVALARAIALDPMLVMYDEPFAGLDPISLGVVGQLIRRLNDALGITSVVVTHDVYESLKIVDYLYFVSEGRIIAQGTPGRGARVRRCVRPPVRRRRAGRPGAVPLSGAPYRAELLARA